MSTKEVLIIVPEDSELAGERLDKSLAALIPDEITLSRSRIQELIANGLVRTANETITNPKFKTKSEESYTITLPDAAPLDLQAENIHLDIVYEDSDLLVINKPAGMIVHPGTGVRNGTLVNAILHHCQGTLSGIGGVERPGIVHRIDKDTSGLLIVAKNDAAHQGLGKQFRAHSIHRRYIAFCFGVPSVGNPRVIGVEGVSAEGVGLRIDLPIGRHKTDRKKMAVSKTSTAKHAITHVFDINANPSEHIAQIHCQLETGRTHQIRVHLAHIGHALLGDPVYGRGAHHLAKSASGELRAAVMALQGQALHAAELGFVHPISGEAHHFTTPLPSHLEPLAKLIHNKDNL